MVAKLVISKKFVVNMIENTYEWNTFTKHWDISWVISNQFHLMVVVTLSFLVSIKSDFTTFNASSCLWNWASFGFSSHPAIRLCRAKCSSKGSCDNFSLSKYLTPSSCKSSLANSINEFTTKKVKYHLLKAVCKYIILIYAFCKHHVEKIVILSRS